MNFNGKGCSLGVPYFIRNVQFCHGRHFEYYIEIFVDFGIELLPDLRFNGIEYVDDSGLVSKTTASTQRFLNELNISAAMYGMRSVPSKCKVLLQDWTTSDTNLVTAGNLLEIVDKFTYLGSIISASFEVSDDMNGRIEMARFDFARLRHIWRKKDKRFRIYCIMQTFDMFFSTDRKHGHFMYIYRSSLYSTRGVCFILFA
jgi:hypothetical protein